MHNSARPSWDWQKNMSKNNFSPMMKGLKWKRSKRYYTWHLLIHTTYFIEINTQFLFKECDIYSISYSLENKELMKEAKIICSSWKMAEAFKWFCSFLWWKGKLNINVVIYIINYLHIICVCTYIYIFFF